MENIIPIVGKSKMELERSIKQGLQKNTKLTTRNVTSTLNMVAEPVIDEFGVLYGSLGTVMRSHYISTANGTALERIGDLFSLVRGGQQVAQAIGKDTFKFYLDIDINDTVLSLLDRVSAETKNANLGTFPGGSASTSFIIKNGITITTQDNKNYTTLDDVEISDSSRDGWTGILANGPGDFYNVGVGDLIFHKIIERQPELGAIIDYLKCTNIQSVSNGSRSEDDDNFRWRIANYAVSSANANMISVRAAILNLPGVSDIIIQPRIYGNGTTGIIIQTVNPVTDDGTLKTAQAIVDSIKSVSEKFYVSSPEYLGISLGLDLYFKPGAEREKIYVTATKTIVDYINKLPIGGQFIINEIIQRVMDIDDKILDMTIRGMGFGVYNRYTGQLEDYTPLKVSNQRCDWDQKWFTNGSWCVTCEGSTR